MTINDMLLATVTLSPPQTLGLMCLQATSVWVWWWQRRPRARGGAIAYSKALWLVYAITLWLMTPTVLAWNAWVGDRPFAAGIMGALAGSMLLRGAVEMLMLARGSWRVHHGKLHDWLHLGLTVGLLHAALLVGVGGVGVVVMLLTVVALLSELRFVDWFHAATGGPEAAIYFVPAEAHHTQLLRRSTLIFLPQYLLFITLLLWSLRTS